MAASIGNSLLQINDLHLLFERSGEQFHTLRGLDLSVTNGEVHALAGESGSGKTVTALSVMGLIPTPPGRITRGAIRYLDTDLLPLSERRKREIRGKDIGMIFQEPRKYLNPSMRVGEQIVECLTSHMRLARKSAKEEVYRLFESVGLRDGKGTFASYPHELSGGMSQRIMIAMSIACKPDLLIADEPTTALDVTLQYQILRLLYKLKSELSMSVLFISHDLGVVHEIADRVSVIYAGRIVESATRHDLFRNPLHPYTQLLLLSFPEPAKRGMRLKTIPGRVLDAGTFPTGCAFHPRCPLEEEICHRESPPSVRYEQDHYAACHMIGKKWTTI